MGSCGALWWRRPDLVNRGLATASAPSLVLVLPPSAKRLLEAAELGVDERRQRRARMRVVGEAAPPGRVEEREGLAPPRARRGVVGAQAAVDDAALVPHPVLHVPQRRRGGRRRLPGRRRRHLRCGGRGGPLVGGDCAVPGACGGVRRRQHVAVVARGAEAGAPLRVEGPPPRLVRQARVRLHANP
jgi:hypothetical protein